MAETKIIYRPPLGPGEGTAKGNNDPPERHALAVTEEYIKLAPLSPSICMRFLQNYARGIAEGWRN